MCEAIRQLKNQSRKEGMLKGRRQGRKEGEKAGSAKERQRFRAQLAEAYLAKEISLPVASRLAMMGEQDFLAYVNNAKAA